MYLHCQPIPIHVCLAIIFELIQNKAVHWFAPVETPRAELEGVVLPAGRKNNRATVGQHWLPTPALYRGRPAIYWRRPPLPGGGSVPPTYPVADCHYSRLNDSRTEEQRPIVARIKSDIFENSSKVIIFGYFPTILTRALLGGGAFERPPLRFFEDSKKTAARSAAGFSPTLSPIFSATFVKISTQCHVRSGHQVRSSDPTTK